MTTKRELKERAKYARNLADLLMLKALNMSTPQVQELIKASIHIEEKCRAIFTDDEDAPLTDFESIAASVDNAEALLTKAPQD